MPYPAILFDLDGTLVDSLRDIAISMNTVLKEKGWPAHPVENYNTFVGDGMDVLAHRVMPDAHRENPAERSRIVNRMKRVYSDQWHLNSRPYEGIPELLATLSMEKIQIGVLSNKPDEFTVVMVEHFFPDILWGEIRGARPGTPVKPSPEAALAIAETWDLPPGHILYAGDTHTDMRTALNAGMPAIGVTWGFRDRAELEQNGARWIVDRPLEILDIARGAG